MTRRSLFRSLALGASLLVSFAVFAQGAHPAGQNPAQMKFVNAPPFPTCALISVQNGDPATGPSISYAKIKAGCVFPWHWHTPSEHIMMVSGTAKFDVKDGESFTLKPGGFALMPGKHVHQARCTTDCTMYVYGDGAFDMHYVDKQGSEISPDAALKAVKEIVSKPAM
jgi:quercetin dioxygenase-like cupin family protein